MLQFLMNSIFIRFFLKSYAGSSSKKTFLLLRFRLINWENALAEVLLSQKDEDDDEIVKMVVGSDIVAG
ncbi:unnamed protein product [Brassica oleracea]